MLKESQMNSSYPFVLCPEDKPVAINKSNSNETECVPIPAGQFYVLKDGTLYKPKNATNIPALNKSEQYVEDENNTLAMLSEAQMNSSKPFVLCPEDKPVAVNKTNSSEPECVAVPVGQFYVLRDGSFFTPPWVTNVTALANQQNYIEDENHTLSDLNETITNSSMPYKICPAENPVGNVTNCLDIPEGSYYQLADDSLYDATFATNVDALAESE